MDEVKRLLLAALVKISDGDTDEAHELVEEAVSSLPTHSLHYSHRHGDDFYLLRYEGEGDPTKKEIISQLDLDYEPDKEELLDVSACPNVFIIEGEVPK